MFLHNAQPYMPQHSGCPQWNELLLCQQLINEFREF